MRGPEEGPVSSLHSRVMTALHAYPTTSCPLPLFPPSSFQQDPGSSYGRKLHDTNNQRFWSQDHLDSNPDCLYRWVLFASVGTPSCLGLGTVHLQSTPPDTTFCPKGQDSFQLMAETTSSSGFSFLPGHTTGLRFPYTMTGEAM